MPLCRFAVLECVSCLGAAGVGIFRVCNLIILLFDRVCVIWDVGGVVGPSVLFLAHGSICLK